MITREDVPYDLDSVDDGGLLFAVERSKSGSLTVKVRVYGHLTVDGVEYSYDQDVRVSLKKDKL